MTRTTALLAATLLLPPAFAADAKPTNFAERQQPIFQLLQVEEAWKITRGAPDCVVGVVDMGFDYFHPAFAGTLKPGWFAPGVYHTDHYQMDTHGTLVASIIAAKRPDGQDGMWGLAPGCSVLTAAQGAPVNVMLRLHQQFFAANPAATTVDWQKDIAAHGPEIKAFSEHWTEFVFGTLAEGIRYLVDHGVRVINISEFVSPELLAGYPELRSRFESAFAYAKQKDVLIVVGAGNSDRRVVEYPGDRNSVMVVGASTLADRRWSAEVEQRGTKIPQGSCYGPRLSVVAPIEKIVTAIPHEAAFYNWKDSPMGEDSNVFRAAYEVQRWGATSSAAPQAAALAALVRSLRPDLKTAAVIHVIEQGADDIGTPGFHEETGYGRLNFLKTLKLAQAAEKAK